MAPRKKPPVPVLVVDSAYGIKGIRRTAGRMSMPGGITVIDASTHPSALPESLTPSEIHTHMQVAGVAQAENIQAMLGELMERAGMAGHEHYNEPMEKVHWSEPLRATCRCGATRERPRGPHEWSDWS